MKLYDKNGVIMKRKSATFVGWQGVILAVVFISAGLPGPAYCQTRDPVLLLQQTPHEGGTITPDAGVHHFELYSDVTLTAAPKPGYQFVYWLGDVSDPTALTTIVYLDAPKIVIAVFERAEYELLVVKEGTRSAPIGGLVAGAGDYARQAAAAGPPGRRPPVFERPEPPEEANDFPIPEKGDDFPVPVPEPATAALLALGSLFVFARRRPKT